MGTELVRMGITLSSNLLDNFDEVIKKRGYSTYSEAIRDAIRKFISEYEWIDDFKGRHAGTATIIYDHKRRGLSDDLVNLQHEDFQLTRSSVNIYVGQDNFLEIIFLDGDGEKIKELSKAMTFLKRVKFSDISTISMAKKPDSSN
jgi:CopG family transcriptional regulator, nickel-responsive regulator